MSVAHFPGDMDSERIGTDIRHHPLGQRLVAPAQRGLHRSTECHDLIGIERDFGKAPEQPRHQLPHGQKTRASTCEHDGIQLLRTNARITQGALDRLAHPLQQRFKYGFKVPQCPGHRQRLAIDIDAHHGSLLHGQPALGGLGRTPQPRAHLRLVQLLLGHARMLRKAPHHELIHTLAAEAVVARRGAHFHHALKQFEHRHIECAAAQVENQESPLIPM